MTTIEKLKIELTSEMVEFDYNDFPLITTAEFDAGNWTLVTETIETFSEMKKEHIARANENISFRCYRLEHFAKAEKLEKLIFAMWDNMRDAHIILENWIRPEQAEWEEYKRSEEYYMSNQAARHERAMLSGMAFGCQGYNDNY